MDAPVRNLLLPRLEQDSVLFSGPWDRLSLWNKTGTHCGRRKRCGGGKKGRCEKMNGGGRTERGDGAWRDDGARRGHGAGRGDGTRRSDRTRKSRRSSCNGRSVVWSIGGGGRGGRS